MSTATDSLTLVDGMNELVRTKFAEAQELPGAMATDPGRRTVMLASMEVCYKLGVTDEGKIELSRLSDDKPAFLVTVEGGEVNCRYWGDSSETPDVLELMEQASGMPVFINELVPYGWVSDDKVILVMYVSDVLSTVVDEYRYNETATDCWVLEGYQLPDQLRMADEKDEAWVYRVIDAVKTGKLIRLTERIRTIESEAFFVSDAEQRHSLVFDKSDSLSPQIVADVDYLAWHPLEMTPGEKFPPSYMNGGKPYSRTMGAWFR